MTTLFGLNSVIIVLKRTGQFEEKKYFKLTNNKKDQNYRRVNKCSHPVYNFI